MNWDFYNTADPTFSLVVVVPNLSVSLSTSLKIEHDVVSFTNPVRTFDWSKFTIFDEINPLTYKTKLISCYFLTSKLPQLRT